MDIIPLATQILRAISEKKEGLDHNYFNCTKDSFGYAVEYLEEEGYLKGSTVIRGGIGKKVQSVLTIHSKVTQEGYQFLLL